MHVPDSEYFVAAAHSGQPDRLPDAVRERKSDGGRRAGNLGDGGEYRGGDCVL